jgi:hypothetical protein
MAELVLVGAAIGTVTIFQRHPIEGDESRQDFRRLAGGLGSSLCFSPIVFFRFAFPISTAAFRNYLPFSTNGRMRKKIG